jgi:hypothetical protein
MSFLAAIRDTVKRWTFWPVGLGAPRPTDRRARWILDPHDGLPRLVDQDGHDADDLMQRIRRVALLTPQDVQQAGYIQQWLGNQRP